jgi:hypothetical protein
MIEHDKISRVDGLSNKDSALLATFPREVAIGTAHEFRIDHRLGCGLVQRAM